MKITLTMEADTATELAGAVQSLAGVLSPLEVSEAAVKADAPTKIKERPVKPKATETAPPAASETKHTIEQVREAAMKVKAKHGLDKVTEALEQLGKSRVVDLEPEQYGSFLEKLPAV